ncbi:MAG TPA: zf-HC2 domain-containing protein [Pyrinomonadaceae bacterium]|nr:zf-HC2 domain-containing protein [Pyrinomonadaceae bacterium]
MNCELCQELIGDLVDGTLSREDESKLNLHLQECLDCDEVRGDLESIVTFCREHRGEYSAPPNENALWLRIRNVIEAENQSYAAQSSAQPARSKSWREWFSRSWEVSLPQLAGSVAAIVLIVSVITAVGVRRWEGSSVRGTTAVIDTAATNVRDRLWQQRQAIDYWNQRVEVNKARWSQEMRDTFDRNLAVIDQAVNDSLSELNRNPHDEVSEEMLNAALNEKLALLREFSDL